MMNQNGFRRFSWRRAFLALCISTLFVSLFGCTSTDDGEQGRLVGRSSQVRPDWASPELLVPDSGRKAYLSHRKTQVFQLDLGIKQAQSEALSKAMKAFRAKLTSYLLDRLEYGLKEGKGDNSFDQMAAVVKQKAAQVDKEFGPPVLNLESVYWEQREVIEEGNQQSQSLVRFYSIWVLMSLEMSEITDRLGIVIDKLAKSSKSSQKATGGASKEGSGDKYEEAAHALNKTYLRLTTGSETPASDEGND